MTSDMVVLDGAASSLHGRGANGSYVSLRDAIDEAARLLSTRHARRAAIVVVADQSFQPSGSSSPITTLEQGGVPLFYVAISESQPPYDYVGGTHYIKPLTTVSNAAVESTGGRVIHTLGTSGVPVALRDIAIQLNNP